MLIKRPDDIQPSEITPRSVFRERRRFMRDAAGVATAAVLGGGLSLLGPRGAAALAADPDATGRKLEGVVESAWRTDEELTPYSDITSYNNFYEFGTDKRDPARHADKFTPMPWKVKVLGECEKPGMYDYEDIVQPHRLEERIYRLRCVEAWSMVIPWVGIPLGEVLARFAPTSKAKYVAFRTVFRPEEMRGQYRPILDWPYVEGLRIDEAMHPLTLLTVGLYGEVLPNQNGAPIRLVVPWKYGFKSIKSIAAIEFTEKGASDELEPGRAARVRVLLEREPERLPSPVEPEARAAHRRALQARHADVQRLRGGGRRPLRRNGSQGQLLSRGFSTPRTGQRPPMNREKRITAIKTGLFAVALAPFTALLVSGFTGGLGANPVETITHTTGEWTLRLLLATLAITPLRHLTGWIWLTRLRRMVGLFAFFYLALHFTTYAVLDASLDLAYVVEDVADRLYITAGFAAFVMLVPLAATSTNAMVRRLGPLRWRRLHRIVYAAGICGVLHYLWLVKADLREPLVYAGILAILLAARLPVVVRWLQARRSKGAERRAATALAS